MNTRLIFPLALLNLLTALIAHAQPVRFEIIAYTDRGGGTSSGGAFALSGTIGQPDAGAMSGGNYLLAGGFWGASQTPPPVGSVIIKVEVVGGQVRLRFTGIPGRIYYVERAHSVTGPWPDRLAAITMPIDGVVEFVDTTGLISPKSFYRTSTD